MTKIVSLKTQSKYHPRTSQLTNSLAWRHRCHRDELEGIALFPVINNLLYIHKKDTIAHRHWIHRPSWTFSKPIAWANSLDPPMQLDIWQTNRTSEHFGLHWPSWTFGKENAQATALDSTDPVGHLANQLRERTLWTPLTQLDIWQTKTFSM